MSPVASTSVEMRGERLASVVARVGRHVAHRGTRSVGPRATGGSDAVARG